MPPSVENTREHDELLGDAEHGIPAARLEKDDEQEHVELDQLDDPGALHLDRYLEPVASDGAMYLSDARRSDRFLVEFAFFASRRAALFLGVNAAENASQR